MDDQAIRVVASFFLCIIIVFITAMLVGDERKALWFKKRDLSKSFFNRRGILGEKCHFGYPRTIEGYAVMILMYAIMFGLSYYIIFKM